MKFTFDVEIKNGKIIINNQETNLSSVENFSSPFYALSRNLGNTLNKSFNLNGLYSKQIFWPTELQFIVEWTLSHRYEIFSTEHMREKAHQLNVPIGACKASLYGEVVEAEVNHGIVTKIVTRLPHRFDNTVDICFAIAFDDDGVHVKTLWLNNRKDNHFTIDESKYVKNNT